MLKLKERNFKPQVRVSLEELVPRNNFYRELESKVDLSFVREWVSAYYTSMGRGSIDPVVFFKLQLIMYFDGIRSERDLMEQVKLNLAYRWYIGYDLDEAVPDHSSLTRIRDRLGLPVFEWFFERIVNLCIEAGLVWGEEVYCDGTMTRANASRESLRPQLQIVTAEYLQRLFALSPKQRQHLITTPVLDRKVTQLQLVEAYRYWSSPGNRSGYRRIADDFASSTDPAATLLRPKSGQKSKLGYHTHDAVDGGKARIIVDALVTPATVMDHAPMLDMQRRIQHKFSFRPRIAVGDSRYGTTENYVGLERRGIRAYLARTDYSKNRPNFLPSTDFVYQAGVDTYLCPQGHELKRFGQNKTQQTWIYKADAESCNPCPIRKVCTKSKTGRSLSRSIYQHILDTVDLYRQTEAYKKAMRKRQVWIEPKLGEAKQWHRLEKFQLRGLCKVNMEALMIASVQNLKQLLRHHRQRHKPVEPTTAALRGKIGIRPFDFALRKWIMAAQLLLLQSLANSGTISLTFSTRCSFTIFP